VLASQLAKVFNQEHGGAGVSIGDGFLRRRRYPQELLLGPASKDDAPDSSTASEVGLLGTTRRRRWPDGPTGATNRLCPERPWE
jgi:hypothetical protein